MICLAMATDAIELFHLSTLILEGCFYPIQLKTFSPAYREKSYLPFNSFIYYFYLSIKTPMFIMITLKALAFFLGHATAVLTLMFPTVSI